MVRSVKLGVCAALGLGMLGVSACGATKGDSGATGAGTTSSGSVTGGGLGGSGGQGTTPTVGSGGSFTTGSGGSGGSGGDDTCAATEVEATLKVKPADIIFIIDNSGSMGQEIQGVEQNINVNFAQIIGQSMVDYRVIMLTRHGSSSLSVCIEAPLSTIAQGGCANIGTNPPGNNPGKFYHYSTTVSSHNSLCKVLETFENPSNAHKDGFGLAPNGWQAWLRPEALKVFVELSDDGIVCSYNGKTYNDQDQVGDTNPPSGGKKVALDYDKDLLAKSPMHFGDTTERNYQWYSLVGLGAKDVNQPLLPHAPADPVTSSKCSPGSVSPGTGYQWLSKGTNALRFPLCNPGGYDVVFQAIAQGVVSGATVPCEFAMPEPGEGEVIDPDTLVVKYTPGGMGMPTEFKQVKTSSLCGPERFYIENDVIKICPEACATLTNDPQAKVDIEVGCGEIID